MEKSNETMVDETINDLLVKLGSLSPSDKEYGIVAENLTTLYKAKNEEIKSQVDTTKLGMEVSAQKQKKLIDAMKLGLDGAAIILPLVFYGVWMKRGFEFEKEGTFTSSTFRGLFNRFKPNK